MFLFIFIYLVIFILFFSKLQGRCVLYSSGSIKK